MRKMLTLKTLLRSPLKTILTLFLIAVASFALFSRVTGYVVTMRETMHAESFYSGVASLDNTVPDIDLVVENAETSAMKLIETGDKPWPTDEQIEEFVSLPGVTLADTRYMTAGLVEGYRRLIDKNFYYKNNRFVIEGTYIGYEELEENANVLELAFDDVMVLAGDIRIDPEKPTIVMSSAVEDKVIYKNPFPLAFIEKLEKGSRCLVVGEYNETTGGELGLDDQSEENFRVLDGLAPRYLETEAFAYHKGLIEVINQRMYAYDIVYTSDMRSIPRFNERNMVISEGRPLMTGDTDTCVVSTLFMETHNLAVGDRINIELGDELFPQSGFRGIVSKDSGSVLNFVDTAELEIVGVYQFADAAELRMTESQWSYTPSTIFVPVSLLPVKVPADYEISIGQFSVLIEDAHDIETFLSASELLVQEMGVAMPFSDGGWMSVKDSFETGLRMAFLSTVLYLVGAVLALFLAVYLYIGRNKKAYAIMRTFGVPSGRARNSLALPLVALSALAIPVGGIAGLLYASSEATAALEGMMDSASYDYVLNASLPVGVVILCLLCELIFILCITSLFLWKMRRTPPLELLQGNVIRARVDKKAVSDITESASIPVRWEITQSSSVDEMPPHGKYGALRHVTTYLLRHMRRGVGKTVISLILALVLTAGIGLFVLTRLTHQEAFREMEVNGRTLEFSSSSIDRLSKSDLIKDFYYYDSFGVRINDVDLGNSITVTNDIDRYLTSHLTDNDYTVTYATGLDASSFTGTGALCLLGEAIAEVHDVRPGDKIALFSNDLYFSLAEDVEDEEKFLEVIQQATTMYKVGGIIDSEDEGIAHGVFAAANSAAENLYGQPFPLEYSEFTLADNERLDELNDLLDRQIVSDRTYAPLASFYIDSVGLDNIRRIRDLLNLFFPVTVVAAVLIGIFGPGLMIMQSAKEAALLRILGVTKKRVRCMLVFEQILLCTVGISLVAGGLLLYNSGLFARSAGTLAVCGALYLSGCVCGAFGASIQVTRHRILELIQVKE